MPGMNRRTLLAVPLLALAAAAPVTPQDQSDLQRIQDYLNGLHTLKARFLQVAPDGQTAAGIAWLERPGRMRFQYDKPNPLLLVAGHGLFVYYDRELRQITNIPLGSTPLGLLLRADIRLSGDITVSDISRGPGMVQITTHKTGSPGDGSLTLIFADAPLALRQWIVTDAQQRETRVTLYDVQLGGTFDQDMFIFVDPKVVPGGDKYYQ